MGMTGTYCFCDNVALPAAPGSVYYCLDVQESTPTVPGMVSPFRRASLLISAVFEPAYGSGAAGMLLELQASLDGATWFKHTIHDRLATVPDPLVADPDAIVGAQDLQTQAVVVDTDMNAEVADTQNHFPYFRLAVTNPTKPCTLSAWLHASG